MKILVTGCAGFIGFHLTKRLLSEGHDVVGVDNMNDYYDPELKISRLRELGVDAYGLRNFETARNLHNKFLFIKAGIESPVLYERNLKGRRFDIVCNLAAQAGVRYSIDNPEQYVSSNVEGFFRILEYCRHNPVRRLVFASSSSVYGKNGKIPYTEEDKTDSPLSLYAATKKSNELFAHCYSELYGIEAIGLRFFTVYGPWGRPDMAPFIFTKSILEGKPIKVFNEGSMSRDFTYIDDTVEGVCAVMFEEPDVPSPGRYRIYNIGCSTPVNLMDFISTVERVSGRTAQKNFLPMQPGDVKDTWADVSLMREHYGYAPSVPVEKGVEEFVAWYREFYA